MLATMILLPLHFLFAFLLFFAAFSPAHLLIVLILAFAIGIACGYAFRNSLGRDLSQFQISAIVKHLENYQATVRTEIEEEVTALVGELKKLI